MIANRTRRKSATKTKAEQFCPHCGAPIQKPEQKNAVVKKDADREYDHRGVLMPRRTRMGGIILPQ